MSAEQIKNVSYGLSQPLINQPPQPIISKRNPTGDDKAALGTLWVNSSNNTAYIITSIVANIANWATIT